MDENDRISEKIRTFIRLRPQGKLEDTSSEEFYLTGSGCDHSLSITDHDKNGSCVYYSNTLKRDYKFKFDGFFDGDVNQAEIYETAVSPLVVSVLKGYAATIFAYGPTGSGKTHTMMGEWTSSLKGIIPRVFDQLLQAKQSDQRCLITMSYLQIYCEVLTDLLDPRPVSLSIRESGRNGVFVDNLSEITINSNSDVREALERGNNARFTAATNANATSSRSHAAILIKVVTADDLTDCSSSDLTDHSLKSKSKSIREGTLVLVDLAGSERATATAGKNYMRAEESKSINLSLSALGNCISALSKQQTTVTDDRDRAKYVPYRDSKLTRLLQGALGGGARTSVIVNISPGPDTTGEVLNALRFASRCTSISVVAKVHRAIDYESLYTQLLQKCDEFDQRERQQQNEIEKQYEISEEQEMQMESLREECAVLKRELESLRQVTAAKASPRNNQEREETEVEDSITEWSKKLEEMSTQHLAELNTMRQRYDQKVAAYKRSAQESNQEIESLQSDLQRERERHLETLKDFRIVKERSAEMEREYEMRIQELLLELQDQTQKAELEAEISFEELKHELDEKKQTILYLEEQVSSAESHSSGDMVSRSQVEEMESIFVETIDRLSARVMQLEEDKVKFLHSHSSSSSLHDFRTENSHQQNLPAVPPRGARIEPGKVRARGTEPSMNGWMNGKNSSLNRNKGRF